MKTGFNVLPAVVCVCIIGGSVLIAGCGESAPPPAPAIDEAPTPEYEAGEAAYQQQS